MFNVCTNMTIYSYNILTWSLLLMSFAEYSRRFCLIFSFLNDLRTKLYKEKCGDSHLHLITISTSKLMCISQFTNSISWISTSSWGTDTQMTSSWPIDLTMTYWPTSLCPWRCWPSSCGSGWVWSPWPEYRPAPGEPTPWCRRRSYADPTSQ